MSTSLNGIFFTQYYKGLFSRGSTVKLFGSGLVAGLNGLLPLDNVAISTPASGYVIRVSNKSYITLSWYPVAYADSYNVYKVESTNSGFSDTPIFYKNTEDLSTYFLPTVTGGHTYWVHWKVHPVTQGYESTNADIFTFSYTRYN